MSLRTPLTGDGAWHNIGTGPATIQLIAPDGTEAEVMIVVATVEPTGVDGLVLRPGFSTYHATTAQTIWAQVVEASANAILAVQPEAS